MTSSNLDVFYLLDGHQVFRASSVQMDSAKTISDLRMYIKTANSLTVPAYNLSVWRVTNEPTEDPSRVILLDNVQEENKMLLSPFQKISDVLTTGFVVVKQSLAAAGPVSPLGPRLTLEQWGTHVAKLETDFFKDKNYEMLPGFIQASGTVPTEYGLPRVAPRSGLLPGQPTLILFDLPESRSKDPSVSDLALDKAYGRTVPLLTLFGVSGCGKTRTVFEMLSKQWGFYHNAGASDWGSEDLRHFLTLVQNVKRYKNADAESNRNVHMLSLMLLLSRVIILQHCLDIAQEQNVSFTPKHWLLLQVGFGTFGFLDLFAELFEKLAVAIRQHAVDYDDLSVYVRTRFSDLHRRLSPNAKDLKLLLVVDEAQTLGDMSFGSFPSESQEENGQRPILSPLVHGFYRIAVDSSKFCVVVCGTGLSILELQWLEASAISKNFGRVLGPFTEFQGWDSPEQVRNYILQLRSSLPDDQTKERFNARVPLDAVPMLFENLRGRFRPIVSAIEYMLCENHGMGWTKSIDYIEQQLTSPADESGSIAFDIRRLLKQVAANPSRYKDYQNIRTVLQNFVLESYLHGSPLVLHGLEPTLVEASVGRIMSAAGKSTTVLDEPFVLRAAVNYFQQQDPQFHNAICNCFGGNAPTPSVLGHKWELVVMPSLVGVFHDKVLTDTCLIPNDAVPRMRKFLKSKATIVGLQPDILGTDYRRMSLNEFFEAHVKRESRLKDGSRVPAFYRLAETPSGPDIACVLHFEGFGFCPLVIQLKLRSAMQAADILKAFTTVKIAAVESHLGDSNIGDFCTITPNKCYLGVVIAYPTALGTSEGTFPLVRKSKRLQAEVGETKTQCIVFKIDKDNIHNLFPPKHIGLLDILKDVNNL